jgi:uncharacterized protein YcaQ
MIMRTDAKPLQLDAAEARRLSLRAAAGFPSRYRAGPEGILQAIESIGFIQIDTISVVERAHHHILWSRIPGYERGMIASLEGSPRRILEYWAHAASYVPIRDYRFCLPRMERVRNYGHDWYRCDEATVASVRDRIRAEGPLEAKDFEDSGTGKRGWWDRKPAKQALEFLHQSGEIVTATRTGFRKVYDLAERHIDASVDARMPTLPEMGDWYVRQAARAYGLFARDEIAYQRKELKEGIDAALSRLVESGELVHAEVEGLAGRGYWLDSSLLSDAKGIEPGTAAGEGNRLYILSPFDPFLIIRKRLERLFGVRYTIECYLPEAKRSFGYFALPLLLAGPAGASFAGLMDAKADRRSKRLVVNRLLLSPSSGPKSEREAARAALLGAAAESIASYARFNGAEAVSFGLVEAPGGAAFAKRLSTAVGRLL